MLPSEGYQLRSFASLPCNIRHIAWGHQWGWWHPGVVEKLRLSGQILDSLSVESRVRVLLLPKVKALKEIRIWREQKSGWEKVLFSSLDLEARALFPKERLDAFCDKLLKEQGKRFFPQVKAWVDECARPAWNPGLSLVQWWWRALLAWCGDAPDRYQLDDGWSHLLEDPLWNQLLSWWRKDYQELFEAYNKAVKGASFPGIAPLQEGEVPFWKEGRTAKIEDLDGVLTPKALSLTAWARRGCDIWIHGVGGGRYEPLNDQIYAGYQLSPWWVVSSSDRLCPQSFWSFQLLRQREESLVQRIRELEQKPERLIESFKVKELLEKGEEGRSFYLELAKERKRLLALPKAKEKLLCLRQSSRGTQEEIARLLPLLRRDLPYFYYPQRGS